jgi:hypothetical protein
MWVRPLEKLDLRGTAIEHGDEESLDLVGGSPSRIITAVHEAAAALDQVVDFGQDLRLGHQAFLARSAHDENPAVAAEVDIERVR